MHTIAEQDKAELTVETMSEEALKTSEIEGEYLNRDSLQSSIRKNLYATPDQRKVKPAEQGIADMMTDLYQNFSNPLTEEMPMQLAQVTNAGKSKHKRCRCL